MYQLTLITLLTVFVFGFLFGVDPIQLLVQLIYYPVFQILFLGAALVNLCYFVVKYIASRDKAVKSGE